MKPFVDSFANGFLFKWAMNFNDLQTKRLRLSLLSSNDVDITFSLRSNEEVQKYIQREPYKNRVEAENQVKMVLNLQEEQEAITWIIKLKSNSKKVGSMCFWNFSSDKKTAEIGYDLLPEFHNKGIMNEAMIAVLDFGFQSLQFKTIDAYTSKHNKGSIALLIKNNFALQKNRIDKGFPDNIIYSLSK